MQYVAGISEHGHASDEDKDIEGSAEVIGGLEAPLVCGIIERRPYKSPLLERFVEDGLLGCLVVEVVGVLRVEDAKLRYGERKQDDSEANGCEARGPLQPRPQFGEAVEEAVPQLDKAEHEKDIRYVLEQQADCVQSIDSIVQEEPRVSFWRVVEHIKLIVIFVLHPI